jgi:hypothetical protein
VAPLEVEDRFEDNRIGDTSFELATFKTLKKGGSLRRPLRIVLEEVPQKDVRVEKDCPHLAA